MEKELRAFMELKKNYDEDWTMWRYEENKNDDALSNAWLDKGTSYIYKVGVLAALDANKVDWVDVAVGMQREKDSEIIPLGILSFPEGENDDIGRVIDRAVACMVIIHPVFDKD